MPLILHEMKKAYQIVIIDFSFSTISSLFLSCLQTIFQVLKSFGLNLNVLLNAESLMALFLHSLSLRDSIHNFMLPSFNIKWHVRFTFTTVS